MFIIFDLDHTLIDSSRRQLTKPDGSLDLEHWRENCTREKIMGDTLLPLAMVARRYMGSSHTVIACTARVMSDIDYEYLVAHSLNFDVVLSRPAGCLDSDHVLKETLLRRFAQDSRISFNRFASDSITIDDNAKVLEHLEMLGFSCYDAVQLNDRGYAI